MKGPHPHGVCTRTRVRFPPFSALIFLFQILDEAEIKGGINKDNLIEKLMEEVKIKRLAARGCRNSLISIVEELQTVTDTDHSSIVTDIFGPNSMNKQGKGKGKGKKGKEAKKEEPKEQPKQEAEEGGEQ